MCSRCRRRASGVGRGASSGACAMRNGARVLPVTTPDARRATPVLIALLLLATACTRDDRASDVAVSAEQAMVLTSDLQAGPATLGVATRNPFEGDDAALAQGKRLYTTMNCAGCHGVNGGGAIGPPFLDADWIYGRDPASLHQSIRQGRPNGMPAFGGRLPDAQLWQLALYVQRLALEGDRLRAAAGAGGGAGGAR